MTVRAALTGWGHYLPASVVTNDDLASTIETSDEWIQSRTGIRERRVVVTGETTSSMCTIAGQHALERAGLMAADLDLVICATTTPDQPLPATGCLVRERLGAVNAGAFDLNSACTGFVSAFITAAQFIQAGTCRRVLVVAGETLSRFINWKDRTTSVLFGDGAGAAILEATDSQAGVLSAVIGCQGDVDGLLTIKADASALVSPYIRMQGNEVFRLAIRAMSQAADQAMVKANLSVAAIDKVIVHQANLRIIQRTCQDLGVAADKMFINVDRYGNTGAASVAIALSEFADAELPQPGSAVLLVAFGGGLTWASTVLRWADVPALAARRLATVAEVGKPWKAGWATPHATRVAG
jgi:3-oxoacyl-[acyl-carrier-protein] synthase-3